MGSSRRVIVLIPLGFDDGQDISNYEGFLSLIESLEAKLLEDLRNARAWYNIDSNRIALCGFSASADLSWAMCNRQPEIFTGAVVGGSQCSYIDEGSIDTLSDREARFYMVMARDDARRRLDGMQRAVDILADADIDHRYIRPTRGGHTPGIMDLEAGVEYVFGY